MVLIQISREVIRLTLQKNVHGVLGKTFGCRDCDPPPPRQGQWQEQEMDVHASEQGRINRFCQLLPVRWEEKEWPRKTPSFLCLPRF